MHKYRVEAENKKIFPLILEEARYCLGSCVPPVDHIHQVRRVRTPEGSNQREGTRDKDQSEIEIKQD